MLNRLVFLLILSCCIDAGAQIAYFNQYPTMTPLVVDQVAIPDIESSMLSFAFSMRKIITDYNGPLIRLRRDSDNTFSNFSATSQGMVDVEAINAWRGTANVYVQKWYNQGGIAGDAGQGNSTKQPRFYPDPIRPYLAGDGIDDKLIVASGNMQNVTNNGKEGTVIGYFFSTSKSQNSFGVLLSGERWSSHLNLDDGNAYFDGGTCCTGPRSFVNPDNTWAQFTFVRKLDKVILRKDNVLKNSGSVNASDRFSKNHNFGICFSNGANHSFATTRFTEFILYKIDMSPVFYEPIELNMMLYWGN